MIDFSDRLATLETRGHTQDAFNRILHQMRNPVAFTVCLKPIKKSRHRQTGKRVSKKLDSSTIESLVESLGNHLLKATYPKKERRMQRETPILFGCLEFGAVSKQPHLHLVADNVHGISRHQFYWILKQCCLNTERATKWITGVPVIADSCDGGWVSYMLKGELFYPMLTK
jgi:hypothetical protein